MAKFVSDIAAFIQKIDRRITEGPNSEQLGNEVVYEISCQ